MLSTEQHTFNHRLPDMGVDFFLGRVKLKGIPRSQVELPEIEARFAMTEYPRFLRRLAHDAGRGELWDEYTRLTSRYWDKLTAAIFEHLNPPFSSRAMHKKERRKLRRKEGKKKRDQPIQLDPETKALEQTIKQKQAAIQKLAAEEPLVELLTVSTDDGSLDSDACRRIAPRLRAIAETWEAAPEGRVGWRERALELSDAMELAGRHPDLVVYVSG